MSNIRIMSSVGLNGINQRNDVMSVQKAINQLLKLIYPTRKLLVDGNLGSNPEKSNTVAAIKLYQKKVVGMLRPDGKIDVNGRSHKVLNAKLALLNTPKFVFPAICGGSTLSESDYEDAAKYIGCEIAAIKAVSEVESSGDAYLTSGKPKILLEAHIFSKLTERVYDISNATISSRNWNRSLYKGGDSEYGRLKSAIELDSSAALKSASWGRFQIMGFNYKYTGHPSVEMFVRDMFRSEAAHLKAFLAFVKSKNLDKHLISKDWAAFAKGYNGSAYEENKYDSKLETAYSKYVEVANV